MTDSSRDDNRPAKSAPRFDQAQPMQPQQNEGGGVQQGGFPHEDGGWGQAEQDLLRDQERIDALHSDEEGGGVMAHQRQARPPGI